MGRTSHLSGLVYATNCASGVCDWTITVYDLETYSSLTMTLSVLVPWDSYGQMDDTYSLAYGGALETYNISDCDQLPSRGATFSDFILENELGSVTPNFSMYVDSSVLPQCGYGITITNNGTSNASVFLADSATTALRATISGPSSVAYQTSGTWDAVIAAPPHEGTPPYTYYWSGILTGSGSEITGVPSGSGTLYLEVLDSAGGRYDTSVYVTVCDPGVLTC